MGRRRPPGSSSLAIRFFDRWVAGLLGRHFEAVRLSATSWLPTPSAHPSIVVANHPSWWDPLIFVRVGRRLFPNRRGFGPMDAGQLARYPILRLIGVFGVERERLAGARSFLETGRSVLERPEGMLWVTAQGRFRDPRLRPIELRPGVAHLLASTPGTSAVPLALEYPFWDARRPEALLRFGPPLAPPAGASWNRARWTDELSRGLEESLDRLAAEAQRRDPERFQLLSRVAPPTRACGGTVSCRDRRQEGGRHA